MAPTATPDDIIMLAKAVEVIGGQISVFELKAYVETLAQELTTQTVSAKQEIQSTSQQILTDIGAAKQTALTAINTSPLTLATIHSFTFAI